MADVNSADHRAELIKVIGEVRNRWRNKQMLRGWVAVAGGSVLALVAAAYALDLLRFSVASIIGFRLLLLAVVAALVTFALVRPSRRRVTDMQVALYVEEHAPTLEAAILSAVELVAQPEGPGRTESPLLVEQLVRQAVEQCRTMDGGRRVGREALRRHAATLAGIAVATTLLLVFGPEFIRQGASALLVVSRSAEAASPYAIDVQPGNAKVPRGSDQTVTAKLLHFTSSDASLMVRPAGSGDFETVPLVKAADQGTFEGMLFKLAKPVEYYIESDGVRSSVFTMTLVDLPAVAKMDLEYHFPAYTGLPMQKVEGGGDVAALRGTEVRLHITPTMATPGGQIEMSGIGPVNLEKEADGSLVGSFKIDKPGFYGIELTGPDGERVKASPQYTIDMIKDLPPRVSFVKPGRDTSASTLEEVFVEAKADDDFGVASMQLMYSVNGGPEKTVKLFGDGDKPRQDVSAGHTIYIEELGVKPGDFVSYYAKATDNDTVDGANTTSSDIYFIKIRPARQEFRAAQSQGGQGQGQGQQGAGALSEQQRQIISATFNIDRDKAKIAADKFKEDTVVIALNQAKLRDKVTDLQNQLMQRVGDDPAFKPIIDALPGAMADMKLAEADLRSQKPKEALAPEQRALKVLQEAETRYEFEVRQQRGGGGGGGGGQNAMAEDLADLFQLQQDKLANQYETQPPAGGQQADQKIDELKQKLDELAKRFQAQADQLKRQSATQAMAGATGSGQRDLAQKLEEAARQLDQLTRDPQRSQQQRQELQDASKRLTDAANAARRAAASGSKDAGGQAQAALEQLRQAQQAMERSTETSAERGMQSALQQAQSLAAEQKDIEARAQQALGQQGAARDAAVQELGQQKDAMQGKVNDLQQQLDQLASATRTESPKASGKLQAASGTIRDQKVQDKIRDSKGALQSGATDYSKKFEQEIGSNLDAVKQQVGEAAAAMGQGSPADQAQRALQQAGEQARAMDALASRLQARANGDQQGQGQQGQGQQGQGQQGQGQQGQGQQGQGQQGQGQQGQGQQGQGQQGQGQQGQGQQGQGQQGQGQQGQGQPGQGRGGQRPGGQGNGQGQPNGTQQDRTQLTGGGTPRATPPRIFTPEEMRQYSNEMAQRAIDLQSLRQGLTALGVNTKALDDIIKQIHALDNPSAFGDPKGVADLTAQATQKLKEFDLELRKKLDNTNQQLLLNGTDEAPQSFKSLVDDYFKSLGKKTGGGGGGGR